MPASGRMLLMLALIAGGYFIRDVVEPTKEAQAKVAGMSGRDLIHDMDFHDAVRSVVMMNCFVVPNSHIGEISCPNIY